MKLLIILIAIGLNFAILHAQVEITEIAKEDLVVEMKFKGKFLSAVKWQDNNGENFLILSQTNTYMTPGTEDPDSRDKEIYGIHYIFEDGKAKVLWKLLDFVRDCPFDLYAEYLQIPPVVTDLNKNGFAETWLVYKLTCTSDVSPMTMKIIMHEDEEKFAIRGSNKVKYGENEYIGGAYTADPAFVNGPDAFMKYGEKLWKKYEMNKW